VFHGVPLGHTNTLNISFNIDWNRRYSQSLKVKLLLQDLVHGRITLASGSPIDPVVRAILSLIPTIKEAYHMIAPVPARTVSAKDGRYNSLTVLSSTSLETSVQSVLPPESSTGPVQTGSCS
jgi:hypothetical protein